MKKKSKFKVFTLSTTIVMSSAVSAQQELVPLYKYTSDGDGGYSYNLSKPVYLYNGSSQQISIPDIYKSPKRSFRSAWVATVVNTDVLPASSEADFKTQYTKILDNFSAWNMNAVIFQVRPVLDAYYKSALNPWSQYITGKPQGTDPGYDPLPWMVEETHKRGMEFHAWLNPYRVTVSDIDSVAIQQVSGLTAQQLADPSMPISQQIQYLVQAKILSPDNFAAKHPEWVLRFNKRFFLNPGVPQVVDYIVDSIGEIIENYDVDAIHFDDYFYPYRTTIAFGSACEGSDAVAYKSSLNPACEDAETYKENNPLNVDINTWRRNNITTLMTRVHNRIAEHNAEMGRAVQFGVSPFGIWDHQAFNPLGSNTPTGSNRSYATNNYGDTRGWVKNELIDYIIPQVYWSFAQAAAPYGEITRWWNDVMTDSRTQLYIGHANYKYLDASTDTDWMNPEEVANQLRYNQMLKNTSGSAFFSYTRLLTANLDTVPANSRSAYAIQNNALALLKSYYSVPALVPNKPWLATKMTTMPLEVNFVNGSNNKFTWKDSVTNNARYYVIYKGTGTSSAIIADPKNIIAKVWRGKQNSFTFEDTNNNPSTDGSMTYWITALDAAQNETPPVKVTPVGAGGTTGNVVILGY